MKKFLDILFYVQIFISITFIIFNLSIISELLQVNLFWFKLELPILLYTIIFFLVFNVVFWVFYKFNVIISDKKTSKLDNEVENLKAKLFDQQEELLVKIKNEFKEITNELKDENNKKMTWIEEKFNLLNDELGKIKAELWYLIDKNKTS